MANNRINKYIGTIAFGAFLVAVTGCTDTWNDHYDVSAEGSQATRSLWEQISSNPKYSRFTDILRNAKYYKDDTHPVEGYTFADVINSGQVTTVWVPTNDAFTQEEYESWMEACQDPDRAYTVQQQLMGNHIALWRHVISEPGVDTVKMINGKNLVFDKTTRTLEGIALDTCNIAATNGVIHVLKGVAPFHYNFYEQLKYTTPITELGKYVVSKDTTYFSQDASIEGETDANGKINYVDSVYFTTNRLFFGKQYLPTQGAEQWPMVEWGFGANIAEEDSAFIMLQPTDAAWNAAYEKLKASHVYGAVYDDKSKGDQGTSDKITLANVDSITDKSIVMDLIKPLVYNVHKQAKLTQSAPLWTLDEFTSVKGEPCEYLLNTFGDTIRTIKSAAGNTIWNQTSLFNGELKAMSNGYAYMVDEWAFPWQYIKPDVEVEIENTGIFYYTSNKTKYKVGTGTEQKSFSDEKYKDIVDVCGKVNNHNFFHIVNPGATTAPTVEVKLKGNNPNAYVQDAQVMSGDYEIQLVLVPHWYLDLVKQGEVTDEFYKKDTTYYEVTEDFDIEDRSTWQLIEDTTGMNIGTLEKVGTVTLGDKKSKDYAQVLASENTNEETGETSYDPVCIKVVEYKGIDQDYIATLAAKNKFKIKATLNFNNKVQKDKTQTFDDVENDPTKVDTVTLKVKGNNYFTFPCSYKNMRYCYPTLTLTTKVTSKEAKNGYLYDICIDKIILKSREVKESESEN